MRWTLRLLMILITAMGSVVRAAETDDADDALKREAKRYLRSGLETMDRGDAAAAEALIRQAVETFPTRNNVLYLAACLRSLERYGEALDAYRRVLAEFRSRVDWELREEIRGTIDDINAYVARADISVNLDGADVRVDGAPVGVSPLESPLVLTPGTHHLEVSLVDHDTVRRELELTSGATRTVSVALEETKASLSIATRPEGAEVLLNGERIGTTPLEAPLEVAAGVFGVTVQKPGYHLVAQRIELRPGQVQALRFDLPPLETAPVHVVSRDDPAPVSAPPRERHRLSPAFWTGLAGTAAFGIATGVMWGVRAKRAETYDQMAAELKSDWQAADWQTFHREADRADRSNKVAVAMSAVTGAFVALTAVGVVLSTDNEKPNDHAVTVTPSPDGVRMTF